KMCKRDTWGPWCIKAGLSLSHAWRYVELGKLCVTQSFQALSEDEQWAEWQRISSNAPRDEPEGDEPEDDDGTSWAVVFKDEMDKMLLRVAGIAEQYGDGLKMLRSPLWGASTELEKRQFVASVIDAATALTNLANQLRSYLDRGK